MSESFYPFVAILAVFFAYAIWWMSKILECQRTVAKCYVLQTYSIMGSVSKAESRLPTDKGNSRLN